MIDKKSASKRFAGSCGVFVQMVMTCVAATLGSTLTLIFLTSSAFAEAPKCGSPMAGEPMLVTSTCDDPKFNQPYIDIDEQRTTPVPHRYVHGGFTGTDAKFSFSFPPKDEYEGRFFLPTHPLQPNEDEAFWGDIGFSVASGAYLVQTNLGGRDRSLTSDESTSGKIDPSIGGYRVNAAAAKYSRVVAAEMYGPHRPYGYLYGGSGGAYQTICAAEHTSGVYDGTLPFVMGTPNAIPGVFTVRIHALRVLKNRNKWPEVMDAIDPGGSGDPYATLNVEEAGALREASLLGFPPRGWWNHETLTGGPLRLVASYVPNLDPTYYEDFWSKPGYLGSDPKSSVSAARIQHKAIVTRVIDGPPRQLELTSLPTGDLVGADIIVLSGASKGKRVSLGTTADKTVGFGRGVDTAVVNAIAAGDEVRIDNSDYLSLQTYHRHSIPTPDMYGWNQFRDNKGVPIYPQRDVLVGPAGAFNGGGCISKGKFDGKMIVLQSLIDIDAFPWQADWYRTKVKENLGKDSETHFRLWFTDHAQHSRPSGVPAQARTVSYDGVREQALRDLSAWVEQGVAPAPSTEYEIVDSQVKVPSKAAQRKGIQPVVVLKANRGERAEVAVGDSVSFTATIELPPNAGKVIAAEWDFEGTGSYPVQAEIDPKPGAVTVNATHSFSKPGTYFPVLRATSQREVDSKTPYARVQNLGRARVLVK